MPNNNLGLRERFCSAAIPAVCLCLGIAARVHGLDRDLGTGYRGFDEGLILRYYGDYPLDFIATNYLLGASHHVFHTILIRLMAIGFGGENEIAIRFPAFVFGIACLWMVYQTARQLFGSSATATIALFLTAILPIHVVWSQTARGYSLTMFLSILMTYSVVRLLESRQHGKWGVALVLSGFLSIYAIPTNIYFAFGLACWVFLVLAIPRWANEYGIDPMLRRKKAALFSVFFLGMVALSYLAYLPLLDQMMAEAAGEQKFVSENYYGSSSASLILRLIPDILFYIFQGPLKWFLPLVLLGIFYGAAVRGSYRWLPVLVFLAPFVATLFTGIAGYNRNYLFNLPLLIIFLSAGIARAGRFLEKKFPRRGANGLVVGGLLALYTLMASFILIKDYYPLTTIKNGKSYKQMVAKQTDSFDLIVIPNINDHLYARSVVKQNLKNIILLNKLSGVKLIASERTLLQENPAAGGRSEKTFEMFHNQFSLKTLEAKNLPAGLKLITLADGAAVSVLPEDFESRTAWEKNFSGGQFSLETSPTYTGNFSLFIEGEGPGGVVVQAGLPDKLEVRKNSLAVMVWATKNNKRGFRPLLLLSDGAHSFRQLRMEQINSGMSMYSREDSLFWGTHYWEIGASVGLIPPNEYAAKIFLAAAENRPVFYDSIRLFIIELD